MWMDEVCSTQYRLPLLAVRDKVELTTSLQDNKMNQVLDFTRFCRHISTSSSKLLERERAHLVKMTVPADSIVKTFNVIKHI